MNETSRLIKKVSQWLIPRLSLPLLVLNGWVLLLLLDYFRTPLSILVVGSVLAFLLSYPVGWLEKRKIKPFVAIILILGTGLILLLIVGVTMVPFIITQAQSLSINLGDWKNSFQEQLHTLNDFVQKQGIPVKIGELGVKLSNQLASQLQSISGHIPSFLQGAIGSVFEGFLVIVITVYLLIEGDKLWLGISQWLPLGFETRLEVALKRSFKNYFIGQGTIGLIEGSAMSLAFLLFQIPYALLFGLFIGLMVLVPFGGTIGITLVVLLVSMKSILLGVTALIICLVIEQIVQNVIAPRLIGHLTGVHPVWIVMAILIGAKIAGLLGVVLAVPLASTFKEVMEMYKPKRNV